MPTGLSAVEPVISSVPSVPVGGAVTAIGEVSVPSQDDLDIPLSELIPLSERPHVGDRILIVPQWISAKLGLRRILG